MILTSDHIDQLPCVRAVRHLVPDARHRADHAVRAYQGRHISELVRDLGITLDSGDSLVIEAGCGTLILRWHGNEYRAAAASVPTAPIPRIAPPRISTARRAICLACDRFDGRACTAAGCRCTGAGDPTRVAGICPRGLWDV